MGRNITAYAATKAGVANLAEGVRAELFGTPIKVTVLYPGYIESEMSVRSAKTPLMATTEEGVRSMVAVIEKERASARVPQWPWAPLGIALKHLPLSIARRFM
jgi:short-subunit dehydrogenase